MLGPRAVSHPVWRDAAGTLAKCQPAGAVCAWALSGRQFGQDRQAQLQEATRGVAEALEDLGDDLRFAGELLAQPGSPEEHRRELRALLEAVGQYRAIAV